MLSISIKLTAAGFVALALLGGAGTTTGTVLVQQAYAAGHGGHSGNPGDHGSHDRGDHRSDRGADQRDH